MADTAVSLPDLASPYAEALTSCVRSAFDRYEVTAMLVSGTIIRGTPDARSDLDVHVLHAGSFRERRQEWHAGVPCEIFVNPPARIGAYFSEESHDRRPMTAHMFATGAIVFDPAGVVANLRVAARATLADPPEADPEELVRNRYGAATEFEDVLDLAERDPDGAALMLGSAVWSIVKCRVASEPGWLPRAKDMHRRLSEVDSEAGRLAVLATTHPMFGTRLQAARELCVRVTGFEGFFEWVSPRETV